jgi:hypothetical protein
MKSLAKPVTVALSAIAFSFAAISMPVQAMSLGHAEKVIAHWVKKDAKKVEKISKPVAEAAKKGEGALVDYCKANTTKCLEVAVELAAMAL